MMNDVLDWGTFRFVIRKEKFLFMIAVSSVNANSVSISMLCMDGRF